MIDSLRATAWQASLTISISAVHHEQPERLPESYDRVIGTFQLDRGNSAVNQEASHVSSAIHGSKKAPSRLTRMLDAKKQAKNHSKALKTCKAAHPTRPAGKDCDEYPFKSTHQGAAYAKGHFSAKYIDSADNRRAGSRLGSWFIADRILDGDRFNVSVK